TIKSLEVFGLLKAQASYEHTLRGILQTLHPYVEKKLTASPATDSASPDRQHRYDVRSLLVPDASAYPLEAALDPRGDALRDYERYQRKEPLEVCPVCHQFPQGNVTAAAFPQNSPLGGTVEVFYTTHMRLIK